MSVASLGIEVVTDNWLLQNAAELVAGEGDPLAAADWLDLSANSLVAIPTHRGTIQFKCLTSLLEQLVLAEKMYVLSGWTEAWVGLLPGLDSLLNEIVRPLEAGDSDVQEAQAAYQGLLCSHEPIRVAYEEAMTALRRKQPIASGQITAGTAVYLALADVKKCSYAPHPCRSRFLARTLYTRRTWPPSSATRFLERVDGARVKLLRSLRGNASVSTVEYYMSSIALRCLADSSPSTHPIQVALQVRDDPNVRNLRQCIHECALALAGDIKRAVELTSVLDRAVQDAEKKLRLAPLDATDGPDTINVFRSLPVRVPDALRRARWPREHSAVAYRFVSAGNQQAREIVSHALGIKDRMVLDAVLEEGPSPARKPDEHAR